MVKKVAKKVVKKVTPKKSAKKAPPKKMVAAKGCGPKAQLESEGCWGWVFATVDKRMEIDSLLFIWSLKIQTLSCLPNLIVKMM